MNKSIIFVFISFCFFLCDTSYSQSIGDINQSDPVSNLFQSQKILSLKLMYSNKDLKNKTNDSTYIKTTLFYKEENEIWKELGIEIRKRGNFRLKNCYYAPVKIKIKKSKRKGTLFEDNKKLKLVLPCFSNKNKNDYIIKEYMAYKLFEIISPYHFNTRLVAVSYTENIGKKTKLHDLKGILIEDDKNVAKRHGGDIIDRSINPMNHDPVTSVYNAFFEFMIGCTDFSTTYQHNQKLLFANKKIIPIPYDFDVSGLVNPSYAIGSGEKSKDLGLSSVTERLYRGFKRDLKIIQQVREEFLIKKNTIIETVASLKPYFENPKEFLKAKDYILEFYEIIENNERFANEVTDKLRTK